MQLFVGGRSKEGKIELTSGNSEILVTMYCALSVCITLLGYLENQIRVKYAFYFKEHTQWLERQDLKK